MSQQPPPPVSSDAPGTVRIPLSPFHFIEVPEELQPLLDQPQDKDFEIHSIDRKIGPDGRDLVHSKLVIAGSQTRESFPEADRFPIHFLKSYYPWSFHRDPKIEFENTLRAAEILGSPGPIGSDANSFRASFLPGKPLSRLSPFTDVEPAERCLSIAREADIGVLIGLWKLAEEVHAKIARLHEACFFHGDLELHNIIVCTAPVQVFLIDFENSEPDFDGDEAARGERAFTDFSELYRLAIYLQSGLGRQEGALARASLDALPRLFRSSATFASRLDAADRHASGSSRER
ncbi:MAG TPA: lipopolysaccharide kinase InaA family protein [Chthoniobacteraceae bacterium]|nr:lipopolysaccharide kinase InaA family protein [Chthoniobacteraceae bacterium]